MKKLIWVLVIVAIIFSVWLFIKEPVRAPETATLEQGVAERVPEETTGADDESRASTLEDMMPPVSE